MIVVRTAESYECEVQTRLPFRYGIATMTGLPHLFLRLDVEVDGFMKSGLAADHLPPKWFTKNPIKSTELDIAEMREVIAAAGRHAIEAGPAANVFDLWQELYRRQSAWAASIGYPPLLAGFGVSLVERAVIDAFCRAKSVPFALAVRSNILGIQLSKIHPELAGCQPADFLPTAPLKTIQVRHTVGLSDPLTEEQISEEERLDDGLPQSLAAAISAYGLTHFKIKLCGDMKQDITRLRTIAELLQNQNAFAFSLDANEQYLDAEAFRTMWEELSSHPALTTFLSHLLFVEQPIHRDHSLCGATGHVFRNWKDRPPLIIDESGGTLEALPHALACGYSGISHKNCKGVIPGIANYCLLEFRRRKHTRRLFLTGEDLCTIAPVALLQDLTVVATLGITHVERNGHHYFRGLTPWPQTVADSILSAHGDLFHRHANGFVTTTIRNGRMNCASLLAAPFGLSCDNLWSCLRNIDAA